MNANFKRTKVVVLPTESNCFSPLKLRNETKHKTLNYNEYGCKLDKYQHIYFLSEELVKENDIGFINIGVNGTIGKISYDKENSTWDLTTRNNIHYPFSSRQYIKRVIASTDKLGLPKPSKEFIDVFIYEYNKGTVIESVMVEYAHICTKPDCDCIQKECDRLGVEEVKNYPCLMQSVLKTDKDNNITIRLIKDLWNREELMSVLYLLEENNKITIHFPGDVKKWIEDNL